MTFINLALFYYFAILSVLAARIQVDWDVVHLTVNRDGYFTRGAIGVNGALPIPPVYATVGDTLALKVYNSLNVSTSIHAHGIFQNGTNYLDGSGMVTECGIPPGDSYTYEYYLHQAGTFWLHSHYNHQNSDGLRTPLVIYDRDKSQLPLQYDEDVLLYVEDWFKQEISLRMEQSADPTAPFPPPPSYPYGLINGFNANDSLPINFEAGKRYRIRLAHIGSTVWYKFSISGHKLAVIEADGILSEPLTVDGIDIGPGQRYSVVVQAMDTDMYSYNFTFIQHAEFVAPAPGRNPHTYTGLIQYRKDAPIKAVATESSSDFVLLNDVNLQAFDKMAALPVSRTFNMDVISKKPTDTVSHPEFDTYDYETPPLVPTLFTAITTGVLALNDTVYGQHTRARVINSGEVIEIYLRNLINVDHTMHLYGHAFQVIEYGPTGNSSDKNTITTVQRFSGWPMRRDTFAVPALSYAKVRFIANNPGVWLFHCHIDIHFSLGMSMTFIEAPTILQQTQKIPDNMARMCSKQGIKTSGNGAGKDGFDLSDIPQEPISPILFLLDLKN